MTKPSLKALDKLFLVHDLLLSLIHLDIHEDEIEKMLKPVEQFLTDAGVNLEERDL
jgi:hypothetical protein